MIVDERIITCVRALERPGDPLLERIESYAHETRVPIIRKEVESFLRVLIQIRQPRQILEVGTAIGYSALVMAKEMPPGCVITTIENYEERIPIAEKNFEEAGMGDRITLIKGDAALVLPELTGPYDMIFMDAAKGQYPAFLPQALRLLPPGGVLISDNVLQEGSIVESRFAVTRRDRTIHERMRDYLYLLKHHRLLETSIIPMGDGIALSVRKKGGRSRG